MISGASETLTQGATVTGPCTTDATGRCCNVGVSGAFSVLITATGYTSQTLTGTATCPPPLHPVTYGPNYPATWADDATIGTGVWSSPGNAGASDSTYATATSTGNTPTHYLKGTAPGFAMATDGTELVLGLKVQVGVKATAAATDHDVRLVVGGTIGSSNLALGTAISTGATGTIDYGGPTNMWGYGTGGITAAQANATGLGLVFSAKSPGGGGGGSANTGAVYVGTCVDGGAGSFTWTAPGNATANDGVFATAGTNNGQQTDLLKGTNLGLSVPTGVTILGILLEVGAKASGTTADEAAYLVKAGTVLTGTNRATGASLSTGAVAILAYGGAADLWGTTWTPADVNATGFGGAWAAVAASVTTRTVSVDWMRITVYYSVPTATTISVDYGRMTLYTTRNTYELDVALVPTTTPVFAAVVCCPIITSSGLVDCPLAGAVITLSPGGATATTGSDGSFSMRVAPGTYTWTLTATNFTTLTGSFTVPAQCGTYSPGGSGFLARMLPTGDRFCFGPDWTGSPCIDAPPGAVTATLPNSGQWSNAATGWAGSYTLAYTGTPWRWRSCVPNARGLPDVFGNLYLQITYSLGYPDNIFGSANPACASGSANLTVQSAATPDCSVLSGSPIGPVAGSAGAAGGAPYLGTTACPIAVTFDPSNSSGLRCTVSE